MKKRRRANLDGAGSGGGDCWTENDEEICYRFFLGGKYGHGDSYPNGRDSGGKRNPSTGCLGDAPPGHDIATTNDGRSVRGARNAGRNSIIASGRGFARQRRRQQPERRATPADTPWLSTRKSNDADDEDVIGRREETGADRPPPRRRPCCPRARTSSGPTTDQRSPRNLTRNSRHGSNDRISTDSKRLGNVLVPSTWSRGPTGPSSYSDLYRRRLSTTVSAYTSIRSPEGSTLSICGDSQLEDLSLDEGQEDASLPATSRNSEFSFYRRFVEAHGAISVRSCELRSPCGTAVASPVGEQCRLGVWDSKKVPAYRPYTIEEYKGLSVPKPDRSLGPDKDDVLIKREWLMRRRSYGDSVSARNRERILQRARELKDRESSRMPEMDDTARDACPSKRTVGNLAKRPPVATPVETSPCRKAGSLRNATGATSSPLVVPRAPSDDPYLKTLQQRHLRERELADRLMRQALNS